MWTNLKFVIGSEVSQKEKNIYHVNIYRYRHKYRYRDNRQIDRYGISRNGTDEPVCRPGIEMQMQSMDSWIQCGKEGVEQVERVALTYTQYRV